MSLHGDNPTTACDHRPAYVFGADGAVCAYCNRDMERKACKACRGSGQFAGRDGTETCEECEGTGDGEWGDVE